VNSDLLDTLIGALKIIVAVFWRSSAAPSEFFFPLACDVWMILCLYWLICALRSKEVKAKESRKERLSYLVPLIIGLTLLFSHRAHYSWLGLRFASDSTPLEVAGVLLTVAGVALAMWSRVVLGENWSAAVSIREDHELIGQGPYRAMRHPMYTGMLLGLFGTVLALGEVRGLVALVIVWLGFYRKARKEEAFLAREFGPRFTDHARRRGMFLPRFS
jgi:protein-S-isoprenylcysteine O-methyltransferase Ste14